MKGADRMSNGNTINGQPVTEENIAQWADEAEIGYDVEGLKKRGRPRLGASVAKVAAIRMDSELDAALTLRAELDHTSRSDVVRAALRSWLART